MGQLFITRSGTNLFIIANWKSYKTEAEAIEWIKRLKTEDLRFTNREVVICPPFTLLPCLKSYILNHKSSLQLGAQDISPFDEGAYTGEVSGRQIKEFADYVIIGHSERRKYFYEDNEILNKKLEMAKKNELIPILCISDINQLPTINHELITNNDIVVYEPLSAIGTGIPDTLEDVEQQAKNIKIKIGEGSVLYGGSVAPENIKNFTSLPNIDGVLVGGESLDPNKFIEIVNNA